MDAVTEIPPIENEPNRLYEPGSPHRVSLQARLAQLGTQGAMDLPMCIDGQWRMGAGSRIKVVQPHDHNRALGSMKNATRKDAAAAVEAAKKAAPGWRAMSFDDRAAIFLKAADLLAGPRRDTLKAATMLGQSKTARRIEIKFRAEGSGVLAVTFARYHDNWSGGKLKRDFIRDKPGGKLEKITLTPGMKTYSVNYTILPDEWVALYFHNWCRSSAVIENVSIILK